MTQNLNEEIVVKYGTGRVKGIKREVRDRFTGPVVCLIRNEQ